MVRNGHIRALKIGQIPAWVLRSIYGTNRSYWRLYRWNNWLKRFKINNFGPGITPNREKEGEHRDDRGVAIRSRVESHAAYPLLLAQVAAKGDLHALDCFSVCNEAQIVSGRRWIALCGSQRTKDHAMENSCASRFWGRQFLCPGCLQTPRFLYFLVHQHKQDQYWLEWAFRVVSKTTHAPVKGPKPTPKNKIFQRTLLGKSDFHVKNVNSFSFSPPSPFFFGGVLPSVDHYPSW